MIMIEWIPNERYLKGCPGFDESAMNKHKMIVSRTVGGEKRFSLAFPQCQRQGRPCADIFLALQIDHRSKLYSDLGNLDDGEVSSFAFGLDDSIVIVIRVM